MMGKKLRLAFAGCGDISRHIALGARLNLRISPVACMDADGTRAAAFSRKHRIPAHYDDYGRMLSEINPDAVYIAVPHHLHRSMILAAVRSGVHVLCEKPITTCMTDAVEVCLRAREAGVKVGINYQYRYDPACYPMVRAAQSGALGEIYYARCNLPWHREGSYFSDGPWRGMITTAGGGTLITQASHILDIALAAMGSRPARARGYTARRVFTGVEVEDLCMGIVELENGASISITSSMIASPEQPVTIELYGSRGTAVYTGPDRPRVRFMGVKPRREKSPVWGLHALFRSLEGFRRWVSGGTPYLCPADESLPVLAAVLAVYRSAKSGLKEPVEI